MTRWSLRTQLTFWYSTVMGVTLLIVGVAVEWVAYNRISASIDNSLRQGAHAVINEVALLEGDLTAIPPDSAATVLNPPPWPPRYVQLVGPERGIIYRSRNLVHLSLPINPADLENGGDMDISPDVRLHQGEMIRIITFRLPRIKGRQMGWGQVAMSLHDLDRARKKNQLALAFVLPAALAISMILGWWLAGRALRPIDGVITTARRIRAENLHERLAARGVDDELGRLVDTLNELFERLERNFQQISRFSADVSHELRTPLTIIQGEAEVALRPTAQKEEMRLALEVVFDEAQRLTKLVKNLLMLGRLETGEHRGHFESTPLVPIVEDLFEEGKALAEAKNIALRLVRVDKAEIVGDPVLLHQLGYNLVENAVKYTPNGGTVELSLIASEGHARLVVRDSGIGVSDAELPHIFDRFYRGDKSRGRGEGGTGLGLAVAKQIADIHRATIQVTSKPGAGSEFSVTFPFVAPELKNAIVEAGDAPVSERTHS